MSHNQTQHSPNPTAQKAIAVALAVCINVLVFWMVDALFAIDVSASSGRVLS